MLPKGSLITFLLTALVLGGGGCIIYTTDPIDPSSGRSGQGAGNQGTDGGPATQSPSPAGPLEARARQIHGWLTGRGFERNGEPTTGMLAPDGHGRYQVELLSGLCYVALALGGEGAGDLGLVLADSSGNERARDGRDDEQAALRFCASQSGTHEVDVHMISGSGPFISAVYVAPAGETTPLAELLEAQPAAAPEATAEPAPAGVEAAAWHRLRAASSELETQGFQPLGPPAGVALAQGGRTRRSIPLSPDSCYALVVVSASEVQDADAFVFAPTGVRVAFDASDDRDARLAVCPDQAGQHVFEVRVARGSGGVMAALFRGPRDGATEGRGQPGIGQSYAAMDREMESRGYEGLGRAVIGQLRRGGRTAYDLPLEGGRCYAAAAVGAAGVSDLDLRLLGPDGEEVDRDDGDGRGALVRTCPAEGGTFRVEVIASSGQGQLMYRPYRFLRGTRGAFGLEGILYLRAMEMVSILGSEGYEPSAAPEREGSQRLAERGRRSHRVRLERGQCYAVSAVGGEGLHDVDLELLSPSGQPIDAEVGPNPLPAVRHCADRTGRYQIRVSAPRGDGRYVYQLFTRAEGAESPQEIGSSTQ